MPFKSEKQRKYLWKNHPEIAQRWENSIQEPNEDAEGFSPIKEVTKVAKVEKAEG